MTTSVASSDRRRSRLRTPRWALAGVAALAVTGLAACGGGGGEPAAYPEEEITFVVPFSAGGPTDTVTRLIAEPMSEELGQQIVVQNVEGAGGTVAAGQVADAEADGYEVLDPPHRHVDRARRSTPTCPTTRWRTSRRSAWSPTSR